jgi:3-hydroxybutyrate dehydrogenase
VRDWSQLEQMFVTAEREFGRIDIVCPGAGVYEPVGESLTCSQLECG